MSSRQYIFFKVRVKGCTFIVCYSLQMHARHPFPTLVRRRSGCLPPLGVLLCKRLKPLYKFIALDLFCKMFKTHIAEYGSSEDVVIRCKKQSFHLFP